MCEDLALLGDVPGLAARGTEGEVDEHEAGNAAVLDDVARGADDHRRDAILLEIAGDQTHGLMADGSSRDEDDRIEAILAGIGESLGRFLGQHLALTVVVVGTIDPLGH